MRSPIELATPAELQAATGRGYLRGAVTLLEHAVVLLAHVPADEREPVAGLAARLQVALQYLEAGAAPPPSPEPTPDEAAGIPRNHGGVGHPPYPAQPYRPPAPSGALF